MFKQSKHSDQRGKSDYRPDIDGLRAISVLGVMIYHAGFGLSGGFVGVDVFFVISGYLITKGILGELEQGRFSLTQFWERRIRRILPASLATTTIVLAVGYQFLFPSDYEKLALASASQLVFCGNLFHWYDTNYFSGSANLKPLLHTWSLAIEEQFYLFLPVFFYLTRRFPPKFHNRFLGSIAALSLVLCIAITPLRANAAFYLLPTRAWELIIGCLLAFRSGSERRCTDATWPTQVLAVASISGLVFAMFLMKAGNQFPGYKTLVPVLCAAALLEIHSRCTTVVSRLLSGRLLVGLGLMSYSLYLWHWPLMAFTRYSVSSDSAALMLFPFTASFAVAYASWKWIECPFRRIQISHRKLFGLSILCACVPLCASVWVWSQAGLPQRMSRNGIKAPPPLATLVERFGSSPVDFKIQDLPILGRPNAPPRFLVWGDSYAQALAPIIDEIATEFQLSGRLVARGGTPPLLNTWRPDNGAYEQSIAVNWNQNVLSEIEGQKWDLIIVVAAWQTYIHKTGLVDAMSEAASVQSAGQVLQRRLPATVAAMKTSARVFWLPPPPRQSTDLAQAVRSHALNGWTELPTTGISQREYEQQITEVAQAFEQINSPQHRWIDLRHKFFLASGKAVLFAGDEFCYMDDSHVSTAGAELYFGETLREIFETLARGDSP